MPLNQVDITMMQDIPDPGFAGKIIISDGTAWVSGQNSPVGAPIINRVIDPTATDPADPNVGDVVLNTVTGTLFSCTTKSTGANVWSHVTEQLDLTPIRQDIAMLAIYNAVSDNRAAYNLPSTFIDHFQDDTGIAVSGGQTDVANVDEYFASVVATGGDDVYTKMLLHFEDTALANTASSTTVNPASVGSCSRSATEKKFGTYSMRNTGGVGLYFTYDAAWMAWGSQKITIDFWYRLDNVSVASPGQSLFSGETDAQYMGIRHHNPHVAWPHAWNSAGNWGSAEEGLKVNYVNDTWYHVAVVHDSGTIKCFIDGTLDKLYTTSGTVNTGSRLSIFGDWGGGNTWNPTGYMDEFRISVGAARWNADFTPETTPYGYIQQNATGTLISKTQTASTATDKMSGVILFKDNGSGTTTLGTDLMISLSANDGTNWTDVTDVNQYEVISPVFSTGIKMVKIKAQSVTSGTAPVIKATWANQALNTQESQLHGWAINY